MKFMVPAFILGWSTAQIDRGDYHNLGFGLLVMGIFLLLAAAVERKLAK